ncbi:hypothetical protein GOP47_0019175 [Adiantum capillus-veneris]|uniref:Uncharacterized protein n=1 Tax=Adiantum capillus-veneris TaxID=13818 RepID=A0A9D4ZBD9_ADICA|nr:hypothetical protein GOP47_0019175 [Adiantum capillus-veneris]
MLGCILSPKLTPFPSSLTPASSPTSPPCTLYIKSTEKTSNAPASAMSNSLVFMLLNLLMLASTLLVWRTSYTPLSPKCVEHVVWALHSQSGVNVDVDGFVEMHQLIKPRWPQHHHVGGGEGFKVSGPRAMACNEEKEGGVLIC